ncbi:TonB-dependent receptor [Flavobacterium sp. Sd200]|uniref:TonB-dependent receptor n=1 Tax=Flavobacterium sp. Sd200 TaxID=2692211 RepID=UPI00136F65BB|nr:TonB-dependent receptor [Flavobacterium sp. Sd200]MXN92859.1 TonB-dependent receptor [Flavobacterium sp. Sd200]
MKLLFHSYKDTKALRRLGAKTLLTSFIGFTAYAQQPPAKDSINTLDEVLVQAVRVNSNTPVTFSNVSKEELAPRNLGQDIPILLNYLPSVVTTSDAGNGIGYTGIRVRGADASRVNVTLNGVPLNDSESQGTFWVNMPDFASSVENIQLQRGVGTSTNGAGAFGASLNLLTDAYKKESSGEISNSFGSFGSHKHTLKFSTGLMNNNVELSGRVSNVGSDGYVDRASSRLKSYFLQGAYVGKTTLIKALAFGGSEKTYQAWNGLDAETLASNRRFNYSGQYFDDAGNEHFYKNETDNYQQDHFQLHWNERVTDSWSTNMALHYTKGRGYYENYRDDKTLSDYGITPLIIDGALREEGDLVTRKWLDNDFYGATFSANYKSAKLNATFGGAWNKYEGAHFGEVIWSQFSNSVRPNDRYYDNDATKTDFNVFGKATYQLTNSLSAFGDLQYRRVHYDATNVVESSSWAIPVDDTFNFFNPKAGLTYTVNGNNNIYLSYARANKEPRRNDYENGAFKSESLNDFELGWRYKHGRSTINVNGYYMRYKDQLVATGNLDDVGSPIYTNVKDSYRMGLEADATLYITNRLVWRPNVALSDNKNIDFNNQTTDGPVNLGDTKIAFSPSVIAGSQIIVIPAKDFQVAFLSKYVGEQYMDNTETGDSKLKGYFVNDLNITYELKNIPVFKSVVFSGLVNNIFDEQYISNGYMYGPYPYYFAQAGINFLAGATLKF